MIILSQALNRQVKVTGTIVIQMNAALFQEVN